MKTATKEDLKNMTHAELRAWWYGALADIPTFGELVLARMAELWWPEKGSA